MTLWRVSIIFLFLATTLLAQDQRYTISTYVGGGPVPTRVPATSLGIDWKSKGLAVDAGGNVYFTSLNCIFKLDADGMVTRIAGNSRPGYSGDDGPGISAQFSMDQVVETPPYLGSLPPGLAADDAGNVYVADNGNSRIRKISADGIVTTIAGSGMFGFSGDGGPASTAQLSSVLGLAVDKAGNVLVADSDNHRVRRIGRDGTITSVAGDGACGSSGDGGPAASAQLCYPAGMAMDTAGNLFIAEIGRSRIRRIAPDGTIATAISGVVEPTNVSVDAAGNLFVVSDSGNLQESWQAVRKVSIHGTVTVVAGDVCEPHSAYCQHSPSEGTTAVMTYMGDRLSTAVDATGNLLVAAPYNRRIYRVSPDGGIATAAGNGEYDFAGDGGPADSARLASPASLAVDSAGNIFFNDEFNDRIRKVSAGGIITTVAGNGGWGISGDGGAATDATLAADGIGVDGAGNLFIGNSSFGGGVRKVSPDGIITTATGSGAGLLAVDLTGNLFIRSSNGIQKVSPDGNATTLVSDAVLDWGAMAAVDKTGNLFVSGVSQVRRISPDGSIVRVAGNGTRGFSGDGGSATDAQLDYALGLAVDGKGNLFIADRNNHRIRKVSPDGIITTIAGNGTWGYTGDDGPATDAAISLPVTVGVDGAGNVYFADVYSNVIRVLRPR